MRTSTLLSRALLALTLLGAVSAPAQRLSIRPIRSISPADTTWQDLAFLREEIGAARVVMLGEPTHGEGNVTEAKIHLIRFLKERMGFTTVAFESGFYELDRAQRNMQAGAPVAEAIGSSVFPVWTNTQEFQALLPLLGPGKLRVAGFDSQTGYGPEDQLEELEALLKPEKGADGIAYDYLDECLSTMAEQNIFPPSHQIVLFDMQLGKARKLLQKVAAGPDARRRERAAFWLQNLRSLQAAAHDYATNDPSAKDSASFRATDSNPRDAQMADNLLWYLRQHPREKVICWGALPHFANKAEALENDELRQYRPMGRAVKAALGEDAVYVLGTLSGGGTHGFGYWGKHKPVPPPASGTLEADLLAQGQDYSFVSLKHAAPGRALTTYAFEYKLLTGPWSEVVDGFLFLKAVNPPHPATAVAATAATEPAAAVSPTAAAPRRLNPALRPVKGSGAAFTLSGTVLDRKTGQPVPFATVAAPSRSAGTVSDAQGRFRLEVRRGETVQVSSIGYEPATLAAQPSGSFTVRLTPAAFALADVRVSAQSQDPRRIMQKVIKAAETNYEQQDYTQQVYTRRRVINFDTLRHEVEYVGQNFVPTEYRHWAGGFLMLEKTPIVRVQEKRIVHSSSGQPGHDEGGYGFVGGFDPVRISPLFKSATLGKFRLRLDTLKQRNGEMLYVLSFAAKRASKRATGLGLTAGYSGKVYIRQQDYAVIRYEALWQDDTVKHNAVAHKYYGRGNLIAKLYNQVYTASRTAHVVSYLKAPSGRYYAATSVAQAIGVGQVLGGKPFYSQKTCDVYFSPPSAGTSVVLPDLEKEPELRYGEVRQLSKVPYRSEFWQTYQRPVPAPPAPALEATKP